MSRNVIFVDDKPAITDALKRALRKEPYEILTANSAAEALAILAEIQVDVVVSDEMMPGMSGSEFLAVVRRRYPDTIRIIEDSELEALKQRLYELDQALSGNRSRSSMGEPRVPTVAGRLRVASMTDGRSDYGPTATHRRALEIATAEFGDIDAGLRQLLDVDLPALETRMEAAGVPWTPGRPLPEVR